MVPRPPIDLPDLRAFVHATLGSDVTITDCSRSVGRLSVVWRLERADGLYYCKRHEAYNLFERASRAYAAWAPKLQSLEGLHVPQIVGRDDDLGALIMDALPNGTRVSAMEPGSTKSAAYRSAGRLLHALHTLPLSTPPDAVEHMADQIQRYVVPARACVPPDTYAWILASLDHGRPFEGAPIVRAHRDYSPRNWAVAEVAGQSVLSVFDWERAEIDLAFHDMQRMEYDHWAQAPELKDAFLDGYGGPLSEREQHQLDLVVLINAMASVRWASERGDTNFERLARGAIDGLRAAS